MRANIDVNEYSMLTLLSMDFRKSFYIFKKENIIWWHRAAAFMFICQNQKFDELIDDHKWAWKLWIFLGLMLASCSKASFIYKISINYFHARAARKFSPSMGALWSHWAFKNKLSDAVDQFQLLNAEHKIEIYAVVDW